MVTSKLFLTFTLLIVVQCETINRDISPDYSPITCTSFPCIINCNVASSCRNTNISCPLSGDGDCFIQFTGSYAAQDSILYTGNAQDIIINCTALNSLRSATIHAYQRRGSKLTINVLGTGDPLEFATIYSPYGENSELNINCGSESIHGEYLCASMKIYDDYSTNVNLRSYSTYGFRATEVRTNLTVIITEINRNGIDPIIRGSVKLWSSQYDGGFYLFKYWGTNHGNWFIESEGVNGFYESVIYADHSFITNESYTINVTGSNEAESIGSLNLYAAQNNVNIVLLAKSLRAFQTTGALIFKLICNSPLNNLVINSLSMTAIDSTDGFLQSLITINNDIRDIRVTGEATSISGFDVITISIGGTILNNGIFTSDGDYACLSEASIIINKIHGNLEMYNNGARGLGFYDSSVTVTNGVDGNVILYDGSSAESQAFRISDITIGNIGGSLSLRSDATTNDAFSSSVFKFGNVSGNVEFVDNAVIGPSFASTDFEIESVGGNLLFAALVDNGDQAFDSFILNIGTVKGNVYFLCNTYGGFSEATININTIEGIGMFNATASTGYEFYHADFHIQKAPYLLFYINSPILSYFSSINTFGSGVGKVEIIVNGINNPTDRSLTGSDWDCRNCDEFIVRCYNNCDLGGAVDIYCPENNQRDKCQIHCDGNSICDDINLYTTNGYCSDARFYCNDASNNCQFQNGGAYCNFGSHTVAYGATNFYCNMVQDAQNNNEWICQNSGASNCVNTCTQRPTTKPTNNPTNDPTIDPTTLPTSIPTTNIPSANPVSNEPSTNIPTDFPITVNPSLNMQTITPTRQPTIVPTIHDENGEVLVITTTQNSNSGNINRYTAKGKTNGLLIFVYIMIAIIICCLIGFCAYLFRKKQAIMSDVNIDKVRNEMNSKRTDNINIISSAEIELNCVHKMMNSDIMGIEFVGTNGKYKNVTDEQIDEIDNEMDEDVVTDVNLVAITLGVYENVTDDQIDDIYNENNESNDDEVVTGVNLVGITPGVNDNNVEENHEISDGMNDIVSDMELIADMTI
eukprot:504407_1